MKLKSFERSKSSVSITLGEWEQLNIGANRRIITNMMNYTAVFFDGC